MPFVASSNTAVTLSVHAHIRAQQRSIPLHLLEALLDHDGLLPFEAGHPAAGRGKRENDRVTRTAPPSRPKPH